MFADRVKTLAHQSDLKLAEVTHEGAVLHCVFGGSGQMTVQECIIAPWRSGHWEFGCVAGMNSRMMTHEFCFNLFKQNDQNVRGFWCLHNLSGDDALICKHMVPSEYLTASEFAAICWDVTKRVDDLERSIH